MEQDAELVLQLFASEFVEDAQFEAALGGSKRDITAVRRYLAMPAAARPEIACYFDAGFYLLRYPDVERAGIDPLIHFLRWGAGEWRMPHPLVDPDYINRSDPTLLGQPCSADALFALLQADLADPGPFFSLDYYRQRAGAAEPPRGGLLRHFLEHGLLAGMRPCAGFHPIEYYARMGRRSFDVRSALRRYVMESAYWTSIPVNPRPQGSSDDGTDVLLPLLGRHPVGFAHAAPAEVSVVMLADTDAAHLLSTLVSLRANFAGSIELLLVDTGNEAVPQVVRHVNGATWLPLAGVPCRAAIRGAAMQCASAEWILLLEGGVDLAHDALPAALRRLASDPSIGAAGGKIVRTDGQLLEAAAIVWPDGTVAPYMADAKATTPEANFVRDVHYCSSYFLLLRSAALRQAGDFHWDSTPDDVADAELCLRLRGAGFRVVYDPSAVIRAIQVSRGSREAAAKPNTTLMELHAALQPDGEPARRGTALFARSVAAERGHILFIDDHVPLRRIGSGFVRSNDVIATMASLGFHVTVFPMQPNSFDLLEIGADLPDNVEVMHDRYLADLPDFLRDRAGYYDTMWVTRSHNLTLLAPVLTSIAGENYRLPRVILDAEAIAAHRESLRRDVLGQRGGYDVQRALRDEFQAARLCDAVVACSQDEAQTLRRLGLPRVSVLGHRCAVALTERPWKDRTGMLFVGAIHSMDAPNLDALQWLVNDVLPLVERELGSETRLTVAGYCAPGIELEWLRRHARVVWRGAVNDLRTLYDANRVFVAPARFAAGIPYKVHEAASAGLPVVATSLLCRQLGWEPGRDLLAADATDPAGFARHVAALHRSETLWHELRSRAAERVAMDCGPGEFALALSMILRPDATMQELPATAAA